jgi:energy-coupling factor transport system ATP-binding protein
MKIEVISDFRKFVAGQTFEFDIDKEKVFTIVGDNGCGKTSLLSAIRGSFEDSALNKYNLYERDMKKLSQHIVIDHEYENVLCYDNVGDNGNSMSNAYDAMAYVQSGGFAKRNSSHGEGTQNDLMRIAELVAKRNVRGTKTLLVFDEIDTGLSLKNQLLFKKYIAEFKKAGFHVLIVTHNPFWIFDQKVVFDLESNKLVSGKNYFFQQTGLTLTKKK